MSKALKIDDIDSSSGLLFPYYDHDTNMVYLAGKVRKSPVWRIVIVTYV